MNDFKMYVDFILCFFSGGFGGSFYNPPVIKNHAKPARKKNSFYDTTDSRKFFAQAGGGEVSFFSKWKFSASPSSL